ncbi:uncharacterized protein [Zea mays]|nr:uncharacterized protein LOC109944831 [Zea mays]|eukprot:XP_020405880.1 uncharacterized protein LOC109944831 [Zea mays]
MACCSLRSKKQRATRRRWGCCAFCRAPSKHQRRRRSSTHTQEGNRVTRHGGNAPRHLLQRAMGEGCACEERLGELLLCPAMRGRWSSAPCLLHAVDSRGRKKTRLLLREGERVREKKGRRHGRFFWASMGGGAPAASMEKGRAQGKVEPAGRNGAVEGAAVWRNGARRPWSFCPCARTGNREKRLLLGHTIEPRRKGAMGAGLAPCWLLAAVGAREEEGRLLQGCRAPEQRAGHGRETSALGGREEAPCAGEERRHGCCRPAQGGRRAVAAGKN